MKEILITSTVLIAVISLLRLVLRKRVSKRLIYAAWLLVALRLLVPVQFGEFEYSVTSVSQKLELRSSLIQQVQEDFQQPVAGPNPEERYQQLVQDYLSQKEALSTVPPEVQTQLRQEAEASAITPEHILTLLWISGMVLTAGWFLTTNLLFLRKAERASVAFTDHSCPIPVRISSHVATPCLAGLFRPRIYLTPESAEDPQGRNHVLTHELTHLNHWDHVWTWVRCLCLCIYWFDPLVWLAAVLSKRDCELACDEAALKKLGEDQRIAYGRTLLATVTHSPVRIFHTTTAMSESGKQLKERVNFIVKKPKNLLIAAIAMVLIIALAAGCAFTGGAEPETNQPDPSGETPTGTTPPQTEPSEEATEPSGEPSEQTDTTYISDPHTLLPPLTPIFPTEGPTEAQRIAEQAISVYRTYQTIGTCCEMEPVSEGYLDMSQYLTEAQKEEYHQWQYRITCCKTVQEVHDHIDRFIGKNIQHDYTDKNLFTDDEGNLYVMVLPTGWDNYRHFDVVSQTKDKIVCRACSYYEPECDDSDIFTLKAGKDGYLVTKVERDSEYECEVTLLYGDENYQLYRHGDSGFSGILSPSGYGSIHFQEDYYCPTVTRLSENIWEIATDHGDGYVQRDYWNVRKMNSLHSTYDYAIALGHKKIAYLTGGKENRTLVVCDLFDSSTAQTFTALGFKAVNMPVTAAAFSENDSQLTLTYYTDQNTETSVTLELLP